MTLRRARALLLAGEGDVRTKVPRFYSLCSMHPIPVPNCHLCKSIIPTLT